MKIEFNNTTLYLIYEQIKTQTSDTIKKITASAKTNFTALVGLILFAEGSKQLNAIPYIGPAAQAVTLLVIGTLLIKEATKTEVSSKPPIPSFLTPLSGTGVVCGERSDEVNRMAETLSIVKDVNSVLLVGPAGCGKTTLASAFAGSALPGFEDTDIYELSWSELLSNTSLLGQLDKKIIELTDFIKRPDRKKIIYLDEAHRLYESSQIKSNHPLNIANALKPYLSNGELRMIAATTDKEYPLIENDTALNRRFIKIHLSPLTFDQMRTTLIDNKERLFESKYQITLPEHVLETALDRSRQIHGTYPDKGMKLLNLICTKAARSTSRTASVRHIEEAMEAFIKPPATWSTYLSTAAQYLPDPS